MNGFVPISTAAEESGYSYSMVQKLAKNGKIDTRDFYGHILVHLNQVLNRKQMMEALGAAKHTPRRYRSDMLLEVEEDEEVHDAA